MLSFRMDQPLGATRSKKSQAVLSLDRLDTILSSDPGF